MDTTKQAKITVSGQVQGVFFRANAKEEALALGLSGYAKNLPDGTVKILVQGEESAIKRFIEWCEEGPPSAKVQQVEHEWQQPAEFHEGFKTL